jgi:hypothetical protein
MVAGLDKAVERAEAIAAREEAKRRAGGKVNANVAVHVDDIGRRWARWVNIGIVAVVAILVIGGAWMVYSANRRPHGPRELNAMTREMLSELAARAERLRGGDMQITADNIREQLRKQIDLDLRKTREQMRGSDGVPAAVLAKEREWLEQLVRLKDGWGKPFVFDVQDGVLTIGATGGPAPPEPVTVPLQKDAPPAKKAARSEVDN